MFQQIQYF